MICQTLENVIVVGTGHFDNPIKPGFPFTLGKSVTLLRLCVSIQEVS